MRLAEQYTTRSVRCLELLGVDGWRLKLYGIAYRGERPGFVGAHEGRGENLVFVDWWAGENELHHHAWVRHVLTPAEGPDLDAYLGDRLDAEV